MSWKKIKHSISNIRIILYNRVENGSIPHSIYEILLDLFLKYFFLKTVKGRGTKRERSF